MGLFSAVLHIRHPSQHDVLDALTAFLQQHDLAVDAVLDIGDSGSAEITAARQRDCPRYLVSANGDPWVTLIEVAFGDPTLADVGRELSEKLRCYALTLNVHDDDLFLYDLDYCGASLDRYNSCPQYFENEPLPEDRIEEQRHSPEAFLPLLPSGVELSELNALLARGWWSAHDSGRLDEDGVVVDDENDDSFVFEGERMTAFGSLLRLCGDDPYPFAAWGEAPKESWVGFVCCRYRPTSS